MTPHCTEPYENLSAYLDDALDEAEADRVREHLKRCDECRKAFESLRRTRALAQALPRADLPSGFRTELRTKLAQTRRARTFRGSRSRLRFGVMVAAAAALVLIMPFAALVSSTLPSHDAMLATHDPDPADDIGAMEAPPDIATEEAPEEEAAEEHAITVTRTAVQSEEYVVHVDDVESASHEVRTLLAEAGADLRRRKHVFDSTGVLARAELMGEGAPEAVEAAGILMRQVGAVVEHRAVEHYEDDAPGTSQIVVTIEDFPVRTADPSREVPVEIESHTDPARLLSQISRSFSGSWRSFGLSVGALIVWIAGHVPHLAFAGGILLLGYVFLLRVRRRTP